MTQIEVFCSKDKRKDSIKHQKQKKQKKKLNFAELNKTHESRIKKKGEFLRIVKYLCLQRSGGNPSEAHRIEEKRPGLLLSLSLSLFSR